MKAEKYFKSVFLIDTKLHDAVFQIEPGIFSPVLSYMALSVLNLKKFSKN